MAHAHLDPGTLLHFRSRDSYPAGGAPLGLRRPWQAPRPEWRPGSALGTLVAEKHPLVVPPPPPHELREKQPSADRHCARAVGWRGPGCVRASKLRSPASLVQLLGFDSHPGNGTRPETARAGALLGPAHLEQVYCETFFPTLGSSWSKWSLSQGSKDSLD